MLKYYLLLFSFFVSSLVICQSSIIAFQNFDEPDQEWSFSTDIPFFDNASDGFYGIHDGDDDGDTNDTGIAIEAIEINSVNIKNDFLFVNDLNDEGDNGTGNEAIITFEEINVSGFHNIFISFDYEIFEFDSTDYIVYEVIEDAIPSERIILPKNDIDSVRVQIKNKTQMVSLKIIIKQNGVGDYAGIDNIKLTGDPIIPCSDLLISEYIEGNSSVNFRNNFIEIYNPTANEINLEEYDLVKFTNKSKVVSNTLNLVGSISAYDTFVIEDITENIGVLANISTNNAVMDFTGDDKIALRNTGQIIDIIGDIGDSVNFAKDITLRRKSYIQNSTNQFNMDEWDVYGIENLNNINAHTSNCSGPIPEIEVFGNYISITDNTEKTTSLNNTYFGMLDPNIGNEIIKNFYIKNTGKADLIVSNLFIDGNHSDNFSIKMASASIIKPTDSSEIIISFTPLSIGLKSATITIENNDSSENPFHIPIQGEGIGPTNSPLIISQYYEGVANNKWIEVTNISESETLENYYYLALFWNNDAKNPIGIKPSRNKLLPVLSPGESVIYRSPLPVLQPQYALTGEEIKSGICSFTGDDILIITTSNDSMSWENRIDIVGNSTNWGINKSLIRKYGCDEVSAHTGFNTDHWLVYDISDIDNAKFGINQRIGKHFIGSTSFDDSNNWNNGMPDEYRNAIIENDYNTSQYGNFDSCNLHIQSGKILNITSEHYASISSNLVVDGTLNVEHEGSIIMIQNNGSVINNGQIEIHKTSTELKKYDYTYWSSPVKNADLGSVFNESPQNSLYTFFTQNYSDMDNDQADDNQNAWQLIQGNMKVGKGYTAMAPNTNPFINTQSVIFKGELNNGIIEVPIFLSEDNSNEDDDWNLIGNPYPSALDTNLFMNHSNNGSTVNGSIYYWTHDTAITEGNTDKQYSSDDYAIYNIGTGGIAANLNGIIPTGIIASGQGFFIEAKQSGSIEFTNEMRVKTGNNNFFKSHKLKNDRHEDKLWLNLFNDKGAFSQILIGFMDGATNNYESNFDSSRLDGNSYISFYSIVENKRLAIQGVPQFTGNETIHIGFSSKINEQIELKIGIDHLEGKFVNQNIYLKDHLLKTIHDLKQGNYEFVLKSKGNFKNRFSINFTNEELIPNDSYKENNELIIRYSDEYFKISTTNNSLIATLHVFDILGRTISYLKVNKQEVLLNKINFEHSGMYIIQATLKDSKVIRKKVIR